MVEHFREDHEGEKPWPCRNGCPKRFTTSTNRIAHEGSTARTAPTANCIYSQAHRDEQQYIYERARAERGTDHRLVWCDDCVKWIFRCDYDAGWRCHLLVEEHELYRDHPGKPRQQTRTGQGGGSEGEGGGQ